MLKSVFKFLIGRSNNNLAKKNPLTKFNLKADYPDINRLPSIKKSMPSEHQYTENKSALNNAKTRLPSILCRETVLNRNQKIIGYSFTLTISTNKNVRMSSETFQRLHDTVLIDNISRIDIKKLLGYRIAFIPIFAISLDQPKLQSLACNEVVIVLKFSEELINETENYHAQLIKLKNSGCRVGFYGDVDIPKLKPFVDLAEFILIDIAKNDIPSINSNINKIKNNKIIIATNVKLIDEFHFCLKLPFQYFQGAFVLSREKLKTPSIDSGRTKIISLLNLIRQDADHSELVNIFKLDPALSFKILRYVNNAGSGLSTKINGIDQALIIIGRDNLYRWLTLLLFTTNNENLLDLALMENALIRARFLELCSSDSLSKNERDELFITGIFSLLDILLQLPMEKVLEQIALPSLVVEALLNKQGKYSPYLELAIASEKFDEDSILAFSNQLGVDLKSVNSYQIDALIWA